ncbi:uncharacterized protein [Miscanthus floridulus]|uniref:uncharacterized protein n=1 Tax=Miscanthus floridulus TaxID=154761 RepID=UPI003458C79A
MATQVAALPDDALADVFRGLPLRSLAVVRCVCKAWSDVVDARALLLPHLQLLPRTVRGVFINYLDHDHPHPFVRPCSPSTIPRVDGTLSFLPNDHRRSVSVLDHCNGLLLCKTKWSSELCVCNPATCRWTVLPRWWEHAADKRRHPYAGAYIAFDPAESPQYEVIWVPAVPKAPPPPEDNRCWTAEEVQRRALLWEKEKDAPFCLDWFFSLPDDGTAVGQWEFQRLQHEINDPCRYMAWRGYMDWPPAPWTLRVFSSSTGQWKDRAFVREGLPAGTVGKMRSDQELSNRPRRRYGVYHHGSLYVHCRGSFVTRLLLSKSKCQVIETPAIVNEYTKPYLEKLQNGV